MKSAKDSLKAKFNLTRAQLDLLIHTLNVVIARVSAGTPAQLNEGICGNWAAAMKAAGWDTVVPNVRRLAGEYVIDDKTLRNPYNIAISLVYFLSLDWPDHVSGGEAPTYWPIPGDDDGGYWKEPQRTLRLSLMRHITKRLRSWRRHTKEST